MSYLGAGADWRIRNYLMDVAIPPPLVELFLDSGDYAEPPGAWTYIDVLILGGGGGGGGGAHSGGSADPSGGAGGGGGGRTVARFNPADGLVFPIAVTVPAAAGGGAAGLGGPGGAGSAGGNVLFGAYATGYGGGGGGGGSNNQVTSGGGGGGGWVSAGSNGNTGPPVFGGAGGLNNGGTGASAPGAGINGFDDYSGAGGGSGSASSSTLPGNSLAAGPGGGAGGGSPSAINADAKPGKNGGTSTAVGTAAVAGSINVDGESGDDPPSYLNAEAGSGGAGGGGSGSNVTGLNTGLAGNGGAGGRGAGGGGGGGVYASLTTPGQGVGGAGGRGYLVAIAYYTAEPPPDPPGPTPTLWNPADKSAVVTLSGSNIIATVASAAAQGIVRGVDGVDAATANRFFGFAYTDGPDGRSMLGIAKATANLNNYLGADANGWGYWGASGERYNNGVGGAYAAVYAPGVLLGVQVKAGALIYWLWNGAGWTSLGTAFSGLTGTVYPAWGTTTAAGTRIGRMVYVETPPDSALYWNAV